MTAYTVFIVRTNKIQIEVDADSPMDAELAAIDKLANDDFSYDDTEDVTDYIVDDQGKAYTSNRLGGWDMVKKS